MREFQLDADEISDGFLDALVKRCDQGAGAISRVDFDELLLAFQVASNVPVAGSEKRADYIQRRNEFRNGPLNRRLLTRYGQTLMPEGDGYKLRNETLTANFFCSQAAKRVRNTTTVINRKIRFVQRNSGQAVIPKELSGRFAENVRELESTLNSMGGIVENLVRNIEEQHRGQLALHRERQDKAKLLEEANARLVAAGLEPVAA
jgi:hypothetical protein